MIGDSRRLAQFEAELQRTAYRELTLPAAQAIFEQLLGEARRLNPEFGLDWREDLAPDLAIARAVNGLAPA